MTVCVVGANGMLGRDLVRTLSLADLGVTGIDLPELDIRHRAQIEEALPDAKVVINCAAYTAVDQAETDQAAAHAVNAEGAENLAKVCGARSARLLHVSTDYVFDGTAERPYREEDEVCPLGVYGQTKRDGEVAVLAADASHLVIRTQSLFGRHGPNFVKAIIRRLHEHDGPLRVVDDQVSAPTYTGHLAEGLVKLTQGSASGIVHLTASGSCSWYTFACAIAEQVKPGAEIQTQSSAELNRPARRPAFSVLNNDKYEQWTGSRLPTWQEGLSAYLDEEDT